MDTFDAIIRKQFAVLFQEINVAYKAGQVKLTDYVLTRHADGLVSHLAIGPTGLVRLSVNSDKLVGVVSATLPLGEGDIQSSLIDIEINTMVDPIEVIDLMLTRLTRLVSKFVTPVGEAE